MRESLRETDEQAAELAMEQMLSVHDVAVGETMQRLVEKERGAGHEPW